MKKIIISLLLTMSFMLSFAVSANASAIMMDNQYIHLNPGDYIIIYSGEDGCTVSIHRNKDTIIEESSLYDGRLFEDGPREKKVINQANIRTGPGMQFDIVNTLYSGDTLTAIGIFKGVDCDWDWYLLEDGTYVSAHLLEDE